MSTSSSPDSSSFGSSPPSSESQTHAAQSIINTLSSSLSHATLSDEPLKNGELLANRFLLDKTLGNGSFGIVKLAHDTLTNQQVAIKFISRRQMSRNQVIRSKREVRSLEVLRHPNIVTCLGVWEQVETKVWMGSNQIGWKNWWIDLSVSLNTCHDETLPPMTPLTPTSPSSPFPSLSTLSPESSHSSEALIVMEYMQGGDLFSHLLSNGKLSESKALSYFSQLAQALWYCHLHNHIHRDLKPENILLSKDFSTVKLADFGFVQWTGIQPMTTYCGSPYYASPEMIQGKPYTGSKVDAWSLGIVLYAMLCAHLPFDSSNPRHLFAKICSGVFCMPEAISKEAKDVLRRLLRVDPKERSSIQEILSHPWLKSYSPQPFNPLQQELYSHYLFQPLNPLASMICKRHGIQVEDICLDFDKNWQKQVMERKSFGRELSIYLLILTELFRMNLLDDMNDENFGSNDTITNKVTIAQRRGRVLTPITTQNLTIPKPKPIQKRTPFIQRLLDLVRGDK